MTSIIKNETVMARKRILILYGSQTGCSQEVAHSLGRMGKRRYFECEIVALDEYQLANLPREHLVIFVVATTGDGDPPDNMSKFWTFIRQKGLPGNALSNVLFSVFGMGDSSYAQFNVIARKLQVRLRQLGAVEFYNIGLGDDQSPLGVEGDVDTWSKSMWASLLTRFPTPPRFVIDDTPTFTEDDMPYIIKYIFNNSTVEKMINDGSTTSKRNVMYSPPHGAYIPNNCKKNTYPVIANVRKNDRMTDISWHQDVRHIELALSGEKISYEAGDIAVIYPENLFNVDDFLKEYFNSDNNKNQDDVQNLNGNTIVYANLKTNRNIMLFPPCTLRDVFLKYLDLLGVPKRYAIEQLSHFASDQEQQEKLLEISASDGVDLYHSYIRRERRSFLDVLNDFSSCRPSIEQLINIIPLIRPREFSISSSPNVHPGEVHLCVAVVKYLSFYKRTRYGLCSTYLASLRPDRKCQNVLLWIKKGILRLPKQNAPMILIGPGTGIAPMRALIEEHVYRYGKKKNEDSSSDTEENGSSISHLLFFGNRHVEKDYLYKDELNNYDQNFDWKLLTAFSRDQPNKIYVQHKMVENQELIWNILKHDNCIVYISGSSKGMPSDVQMSIESIVQVFGNKSEIDAKKYVLNMQLNKRYVVECWS